MSGGQKLALAAIVGLGLIVAAAISDFLVGSFWRDHALLTSLVANLLVVAVTVVVINQAIERRDRKRWSLLAQSVLFALVQSARATWTGLLDALQLGEVDVTSPESLSEALALAHDTERLSDATRALLADDARRGGLRRMSRALSDHAARVIADWAPVMVSARSYAEVLDRHVELAGRLEWLSGVLAHQEPPESQSRRERALTRSNVVAERAETLGSDDWLHAQILALIALAVELDDQSRSEAFAIVPISWWAERTHGLATGD